MNAQITLDVPEWQIGQDVSVYFPDTMLKHGKCEMMKEHAVVRCRDCKHRPTQTEPPKTYGFSIEFPEGSKCPCQCDDGFYSWYPADNWFCADGERKDN